MDEIRKKIDEIDRQMAVLYEQRLNLAEQVAEYKYINNGKIFDKKREKAVIEKNKKYLKNKNYESRYIEFLHFLMDQSKDLQQEWISEAENKKMSKK